MRRGRTFAGALGPCLVLLWGMLAADPAAGTLETAGEVVFSSGGSLSEERAIQKVLETYVRAIESRDLSLFKAVKPNLTADEERRARKAFESVRSQAVAMTINTVSVATAEAVVRVSRRDTINGTIVSSFPQTFSMAKGKDGWTIRDITR